MCNYICVFMCRSASGFNSHGHNKPQNTNILIWKQTFIHIYKKNNKFSAHERRIVWRQFHSIRREVVLENHTKGTLRPRCKYSITEWNTHGRCNEWGAALHHVFEGNTEYFKRSAIKMSRRSSASYSRGVWIRHRYPHIHTHKYAHTRYQEAGAVQAWLFSYFCSL